MAASNLDHQDASAVPAGGVINESLMQKIWELDFITLPLTDMISKGTHTNRKVEWTEDKLADPNINNAVVDGADIAQNDTRLGKRLANYTQISVKEVQVSHSAEAASSVGSMAKMAPQVMKRQKELRRDVEAISLTHQGSVAGDGDTVPGRTAGFGAQVKTNVSLGATGVVGGFNSTTGLFVAPTPGTKRALSETVIRDVLQKVYEAGGDTTTFMARPPVIRKLSEYLFTATARVATITATQAQAEPKSLTAYGSVNVFVTDFGQTIQLRDNRLQQQDAVGVSSAYLIDPAHLKHSFLRGYQTEPLGKTGLSDKNLMSGEWSFLVLNELSQGAIFDIDESLAVIA
jgi:hypothetical protein